MEDRHLSDLNSRCRTIKGDDLKPESPIRALRFVSSIQGKCWLCVGTRGIQTPPVLHPRSKGCGKENGANRFSSTIPRRVRWHIQNDIFFQERHEAGDIVCLPGMY